MILVAIWLSTSDTSMRLSRYFLPILKENPKEAEIVSHRLMLRAGMIKQASAGVYSWLPLGLKAGHLPILMPTMQSADLWRESGRYDVFGEEMLRIKDRMDREMLFTPTAEELVTDIFRSHVKSYKDLPITMYQIQWKFRDERRPRFGVMRGREFFMKDGYNFDLTKEDALHAYNRHLVSYLRTFERMGLQAIPMRADSGPMGGDDTHEFLVLAETGESEVFYDSAVTELSFGDRDIDYNSVEQCADVMNEFTSKYARTDETHDADVFNKVPEERRRSARGIEVGQIFYFGTKYSEPLKAMVQGPDGKPEAVHMGSHGIGVSRLVGAIIEASHDDNGIIWPASVAPFGAVIINMKTSDEGCTALSQDAYNQLVKAGIDPLLDDTDKGAGAKFATADLIGVPWQIIIGPRGVSSGEIELKNRATGERENPHT
ncbi:Proline--tRNA ligase [Nymphon striatum]|nr:Proline--tRNA ligase [Nymphon striatum]